MNNGQYNQTAYVDPVKRSGKTEIQANLNATLGRRQRENWTWDTGEVPRHTEPDAPDQLFISRLWKQEVFSDQLWCANTLNIVVRWPGSMHNSFILPNFTERLLLWTIVLIKVLMEKGLDGFGWWHLGWATGQDGLTTLMGFILRTFSVQRSYKHDHNSSNHSGTVGHTPMKHTPKCGWWRCRFWSGVWRP